MDEQTTVILQRYSSFFDKPSCSLCISELAFVRQAMSAVMINWYSIGLHWGIHVDVLDQIKANHRKDLDACFTSAIAEWLTNYNPGKPTWKGVIIAMSERGAGENPAAAEQLAELCAKDGASSLSHVPQAEGVDDAVIGVDVMGQVVLALEPLSARWKEIGIILGARYDFLEGLYRSDERASECVNSIVKRWLKKKFDVRFGTPSWKKLVEAIGAKTGGCNAVHAKTIAEQHLSNSPEPKKPCLGGVPGMDSHNRVYGYLQVIGTEKLIQLGQILGLNRMEMKRSTAKELPGDLITSWMQRECRVMEESGEPTWRSLAKALLEANLTGISLDIQKDFKFSLQ